MPLQIGTYKKAPLELSQRMAKTRQFGAAAGQLHYSAALTSQPYSLTTTNAVETKWQVNKITTRDSLFVVDSMASTNLPSTQVWAATIFDQGRNPLMMQPLAWQCLFGGDNGNNTNSNGAYFPFILDEPLIVQTPSPIPVTLYGVDTPNTNVVADLHGRVVEQGAPNYAWLRNRQTRVSPYWLTPPDVMTLGAGLSGQYEIKTGNWYFSGIKIVAFNRGYNDMSYTLTDPISKQVFMNGRVRTNATLGIAYLPTILDVPFFLKPNARLVLSVTNLDATTQTLWFAIFGRKILANNADEAWELANAKEPR